MPNTPANRAKQRAYHRRRKSRGSPRPDDLQRAIACALRDSWRAQIVNTGSARSLLRDVMRVAARSLIDRGFDPSEVCRRIVRSLRPLELAEDGRETDLPFVISSGQSRPGK
jgi:hypothetical protein